MFDRVQSGDKLKIPAATFNTIVASAEDYLQRKGRGPVTTGLAPAVGFDGIVTVKNASGADRGRFAVLEITGIVIPPADNLQLFHVQPAFTCGLPAEDSTKCVILIEPIASGGIGRAMLAGLSSVQVDMADAADPYAKPVEDDPTKLQSSSSGPFRILYAEGGTGVKWAAVLFPVSAGGATPRRYFEITAAEGSSPPFVYSGDEVEWNSTTHAFAAKTGGTTITGDLRSIVEAVYPYAAKIPVGAFVEAWQEGSDWLCQVVHYKGVYPG